MNTIEFQKEQQLAFLQEKVRKLRTVLGWSGSDLAEILGVSRQTINNIETSKFPLTPTQYLAISTIIEEVQSRSPELREMISTYLKKSSANDTKRPNNKLGALNLLESWFTLFPKAFGKLTLDKEGIQAMDLMDVLAQDYKIFTSPELLFCAPYKSCFDRLGELCQEHGNSIIVPATAFKEAAKVYKECIPHMASWFNDMKKEGKVKLYGENDKLDFSEMILSMFLSMKSKYKLCLITHNDSLAQDVLNINSMQSIDGSPIVVVSISNTGKMYQYGTFFEEESSHEIIDNEIESLLSDNHVVAFDTEFNPFCEEVSLGTAHCVRNTLLVNNPETDHDISSTENNSSDNLSAQEKATYCKGDVSCTTLHNTSIEDVPTQPLGWGTL